MTTVWYEHFFVIGCMILYLIVVVYVLLSRPEMGIQYLSAEHFPFCIYL